MSGRAAGLEDVLAKAAADAGLPLSVRRAWVDAAALLQRVTARRHPLRTDGELITAFHLAALNHGVFLAPVACWRCRRSSTATLEDAGALACRPPWPTSLPRPERRLPPGRRTAQPGRSVTPSGGQARICPEPG